MKKKQTLIIQLQDLLHQ